MSTLVLSDLPPILANIAVIIDSSLERLHELGRVGMSESDISEIDASVSMLTVVSDTCKDAVRKVENGPDFKPVRMTGGDRNG